MTAVGGPPLARLDDRGDRFYTFGDPPESFYSVTTIIGGGIPKYLVPWAAKSVADLAYGELLAHGPHSRARAIARRWTRAGRDYVATRKAAGELTSVKLEKLDDEELALRWLKGAPDRIRDSAAELGIEVHDEAERLILDQARASARLYINRLELEAWPDHLAGHMASFERFLDDWHPEYLAAEATVLNRLQAYGGTLDAIIRVLAGDLVAAVLRGGAGVPDWLGAFEPDDPVTLIIDYKSGRATYPEVALQLAALARGEFVAAPDGLTELPMPTADAGAVLHLTPKGYRLRLVRIDDQMFDVFRFAREVYRWRKQLASTAFLQDLTPPEATEEVA